MVEKKPTRTSLSAAAAHAQTDATERLQAAGLRATPVRVLVIQALHRQRAALSHAQIEAELSQPVDRVTLYRTLDSFVGAGLVHKQVGPERITRFVLADGADHSEHAHFQCDDCGNVYCMPVKPPRRVQLPTGFELAGSALQFHGQCPSCTGTKAAAKT
jgi:Fur family ferric uptake transcriptional regulator